MGKSNTKFPSPNSPGSAEGKELVCAFPPLPIIIKHQAVPVSGLSISPNLLRGRMNGKQYQVPTPQEETFESQKEERSTPLFLNTCLGGQFKKILSVHTGMIHTVGQEEASSMHRAVPHG